MAIRRMLNAAMAMTALLFMSSSALAQSYGDYVPSRENLEAREWFQDAKFGIFIHWGIYSLMAGAGDDSGLAEWVMHRKQMTVEEYEPLASFFYPVKFDADEWVRAFKSAGAKYITITSKHHDGFAMYHSEVSDYNIVDATPFGRDVLKELAEACERHGLKLFFYYSQLDWRHPDYYPRGRTGQKSGRPESGDWDRYIDYQNAQLTELLTGYGRIGGIWFDGWWDQELTPMKDRWRLRETYELVHELQPHALIINNHHVTPFPGEDVQPFERDLPGQNEYGFNTTYVSDQLPLEMAETMNGTWGFSLTDHKFKSTNQLIRTLVGAAGRNSNLLLNTGPMPDGRLQPRNVQTYKEMGAWINEYGESIYGTRGGPLAPRSWGVTTQKGNYIYVHIMDWRDSLLIVPLKDVSVESAELLRTGASIPFEITDAGVSLQVPVAELQEVVAVIKLQLAD